MKISQVGETPMHDVEMPVYNEIALSGKDKGMDITYYILKPYLRNFAMSGVLACYFVVAKIVV